MTGLASIPLRLCRNALAAFGVAACLIVLGTLAQAGGGRPGQGEEASPIARAASGN